MKIKLQVTETVDGALARFEQYLRDNSWYDWDVLTFDAEARVYEVDADHADFFIEQGEQQGVSFTKL